MNKFSLDQARDENRKRSASCHLSSTHWNVLHI